MGVYDPMMVLSLTRHRDMRVKIKLFSAFFVFVFSDYYSYFINIENVALVHNFNFHNKNDKIEIKKGLN